MKNIKTYIPLITPFDKNLNIDYFSLEKIIYHISNLEYLNNIILFDIFSEYNTINGNDYIDIINCINNNIKNNFNIILKINSIYLYDDLKLIINKNIYKNIYYIILDLPKINNIKYIKDIINNYNKLFKYFKYLYFYLKINNNNYLNYNFLIELKDQNKNFLGIIINNIFFIKSYNLIKYIDIIISNDIYLFNNIYLNIKGIISPLFYFYLNYFYNYVFVNINNNNLFLFNKKFYKLIKFINILYNNIYPLSGIKYLLSYLNLCDFYLKLPHYNSTNFKKLITIFKQIVNKI